MRKKKNNGQSIIEYLLLAAAVCVVILIFIGPSGPFRNALENSLGMSMVDSMETMTQNVTLNLDLVP